MDWHVISGLQPQASAFQKGLEFAEMAKTWTCRDKMKKYTVGRIKKQGCLL